MKKKFLLGMLLFVANPLQAEDVNPAVGIIKIVLQELVKLIKRRNGHGN